MSPPTNFDGHLRGHVLVQCQQCINGVPHKPKQGEYSVSHRPRQKNRVTHFIIRRSPKTETCVVTIWHRRVRRGTEISNEVGRGRGRGVRGWVEGWTGCHGRRAKTLRLAVGHLRGKDGGGSGGRKILAHPEKMEWELWG